MALTVSEIMNRELFSVRPEESVEATTQAILALGITGVPVEAGVGEAARRLARTRYHRLIVVDGGGRAVGMVSALDVIRGLLGLPTPHPASFPHLDHETQFSWTDDLPLELEEIEAAPDGPGIVVLLHGGARVPERLVWAEASESVRGRLREMLTAAQTSPLTGLTEGR